MRRSDKRPLGVIVLVLCPVILTAQEDRIVTNPLPPPPSSSDIDRQAGSRPAPIPTSAPAANIIYEKAAPVLVDGRPAEELTDEQLRGFLEQKIVDFEMSPGDVELLRVAPGYALTVTFDTPPISAVVGDPAMVSFKQTGRMIVISAAVRQGDTSFQVVMPGFQIINFHIFIAETFAQALSTVHVSTRGVGESSGGSRSVEGSTAPSLNVIARVVGNYDALLQERALKERDVKRLPIGRKSKFLPFEYYDWFRFRDGTLVLTFLLKNPGNQVMDTKRERIRLQMGNVQFPPDLVSAPDTIAPGSSATGFAVFYQPVFTTNNPFELVLR